MQFYIVRNNFGNYVWATYVIEIVAIILIATTEHSKSLFSSENYVSMMLFEDFLVLGGFLFTCLAIKCLACKSRWYWLAIRKNK